MCRRPVALFTPRKIGKFCSKVPINRRIAETSNSRSVHPVSVTFRLFDVSAVKRFGGNVFRRFVCTLRFGGNVSALRLHVASGSGKLFGATRDSADRRPT